MSSEEDEDATLLARPRVTRTRRRIRQPEDKETSASETPTKKDGELNNFQDLWK